jgi:hypothetical protein
MRLSDWAAVAGATAIHAAVHDALRVPTSKVLRDCCRSLCPSSPSMSVSPVPTHVLVFTRLQVLRELPRTVEKGRKSSLIDCRPFTRLEQSNY